MVLPPLPTGLRTRIAPTPSGLLHAGNGAAFVLTWRLARAAGGELLLRIDDLDAERTRPEYFDDVFRTLDRLGITWDRGPTDAADFHARWSQHGRLEHYRARIEQLRAGGHLYACDCSRKAIASRGATHGYDGYCRERGLSFNATDVCWRLRVPHGQEVRFQAWGHGPRSIDLSQEMMDPAIRRRDGLPAYQLASVVDDHEQGANFIVRGEDLLPSTACQLYLASLLGATSFQQALFLHHPLVRDADGHKLSKSQGVGSLKAMWEGGTAPEAIHRLADELLQAYLAG